MRLCSAAATIVVAAACSSSAGSDPRIRLVVPPEDASASYVLVTGIARADASTIETANWSPERWAELLRVTVKGSGGSGAGGLSVGVLGRYTIEGRSIRFTPMFPLDPGREYEVTFDPTRLPANPDRGRRPIVAVLSRPATAALPSTRVSHVFPSGDTVPENHLRLYIHFSGPMGRHPGMDYITLLDEHGKTVEDPFLPLDAELWNADRTRYTVFFDPGRQKRGILPNRDMGPSLLAGQTYTLVLKREWPDANGQPLAEAFTRRFRVGPPDQHPVDQKAWQLDAPLAGTRSPVVVRFPESLDHGLLLRALGVRRGAAGVAGEPRVDAGETRWSFTPRDPWEPGEYELLILSVLEDLAGNRIGRAFELGPTERSDRPPEPESYVLPFRVASGT